MGFRTVDILATSRFARAFIFVVASIGVVYFHLNGSRFYIGYPLGLKGVLEYWREHGFFLLITELLAGASAVIGLFLISSGYGLSKIYKKTAAYSFIFGRFRKVYLYALFMAGLCTIVVLAVEKTLSFDYWDSFALLFGFYDQLPRHRSTMQYWYLSLAFTYYLLFIGVRRISSVERLLTCSLLVSYVLGICMLLQRKHVVDFNFAPLGFVSFYHSSICRFPEFVVGMVIARNQTLEMLFFNFSYTRLCVGMIWTFTAYTLFFNELSYLSAHLLYSTGLFLCLSQLACFLMRWPICVRIFSLLSGGTFSLYCLHMITVYYVFEPLKRLIAGLTLSTEAIRILSDLSLILCCVPVLLFGNRIESTYRSVMLKTFSANK